MNGEFMTRDEFQSLSIESRNAINAHWVEYHKLVAENARLRESLSWYADQTHYLHMEQWKMFASEAVWKRAQDALK